MTGIFRDAEENRKARGKARLKFLVDRVGPEALREELERARRPRRCAAASRRRPGLSGEDHIGVLPQADGAHSHGRARRPGRPPEGRAAVRARRASPASTAPTRTTRCASPTSRTSCCRGSRTSNVDALLAEPLIAGPHPHPHALPARPADLHGQGVLRPGEGLHQEPRGRDRQVPGRARAPERPRRGLPPALRGLLVELRAAPDRRRRHRGRAQEGRRRVRRGDGHPHRRPPRRAPASSATSCVKKVPHWELNETLLQIFTLYEHPPRRRRDVPRLRGPHRARVVDAASSTPVEEPVA